MTKEEFEKIVALLSYRIEPAIISNLLELNHVLKDNETIYWFKTKESIKILLNYDVLKYVYDDCEFYNTVYEQKDIWKAINAYLHNNEMTDFQSEIFRNTVLKGLMKYTREFNEKFNEFYRKCKEAGDMGI